MRSIKTGTQHKEKSGNFREIPKIRVSNKDRVEDDVMEEILQDPKFEELLKEREQPSRPMPVKKFVSPLPSRQSMRLQTSERADIADGTGDSRSKVSPHPLQD